MRARRRGLNEIRTLGHRSKAEGDQKALLRASVVEAEMQRLRQERRLLEQRLALIDDRLSKLGDERDQLIGSLNIHRSGDVARRPGDDRTFHLRY